VTRRREAYACIVIVAIATAAASAAAAEPEVVAAPAAVRVVGPECAEPPLSIAGFVEALRVELAGQGPRCCLTGADAATADAELLVALTVEPCDPNAGSIAVSVSDPRHPPPVERHVSLADLPAAARPRALALAVAELLRAADQPPPPEPPPPPPPPPPAPESPRLSAGADALVRAYPMRGTVLLGAQLSLGMAGARWHTALALDGALGQPEVDFGAVRVRMLGGMATAGPRFAVGRAAIDVGAAVSGGWAWVRGEPSVAGVTAGAGDGFVAAVGARVAVQVPASYWLRFHAAGEAGGVVRRLDADVNGAAAAGIAGAYVSVAVGVRAP
jgi:hypothetical protein